MYGWECMSRNEQEHLEHSMKVQCGKCVQNAHNTGRKSLNLSISNIAIPRKKVYN